MPQNLGGLRMSFANTAAYFERRAKKARSDDQRENFLETAIFYRELAKIIPTFPDGYRPPAFRQTAVRTDGRAQECIALAEVMHDSACRASLLRLAETYEKVSGFPRAAE